MSNTIYLVMRKASLMEDEGREQHMFHTASKQDAETWIADQKGEFFGPKDYYIAEVTEQN